MRAMRPRPMHAKTPRPRPSRLGGFVATACLVAAVVAPIDATAQVGDRPVGPTGMDVAGSSVWYGVTVGGAGMRLTCDLCQASRDIGPALTVSAGAYGAERLRVGLELSAWTHEDGGVREKLYGLGLVAHLVPDPTRGLYLLGGFGWSGYRAGDLSYDAPRVTVGLGWDVPAFGSWVVGNVVSLDGSAFVPIRNDGETAVRDVGLSSLRFAVQLRKR